MADSSRIAQANYGDRNRCGAGSLFRACIAADTNRHSSRLGSAGHLRCAALWRYEPAADGRVPLLLLRVSLPLYQRHRERGGEVDSGHGPNQIGVPSWYGHEPGTGSDDFLCQPRSRLYATRHGVAICYPL